MSIIGLIVWRALEHVVLVRVLRRRVRRERRDGRRAGGRRATARARAARATRRRQSGERGQRVREVWWRRWSVARRHKLLKLFYNSQIFIKFSPLPK